jgi:hypothetical protein
MCSDTTDLQGKREVKCAVQCTGAFTAKDTNTCELVEVEGDTMTMAGSAKPRDSDEVSCTDKVFKLAGKGGCKCSSAAPTGATECREWLDSSHSLDTAHQYLFPSLASVGPKEYAICQ